MTSDGPLGITETAQRLREGRFTSAELVARCIGVADDLDDRLGTYIRRFDEEALAAATRADEELAAGLDRGPLHGIPIGIKDLVATREAPTTAQSLAMDPEWGDGRDAPVVARLREAGAVITGKLTTMEFALGMNEPSSDFPLPRNPWDPGCWAGGSSSGSASGVAAGMMLASIGTDTAASIRMPAAYCGVTGLKPTYGRVPKAGVVPLAHSLDHVGPLARSAEDCAIVLQALAGPDPSDPTAADRPVPDLRSGLVGHLDGLRVGVDRTHRSPKEGDPAVRPSFEAAVAQLASLGAEVVEVALPDYAELGAAVMLTMYAEALAIHRRNLAERPDSYLRSTRDLLALGAFVTAADLAQAQRVRRVVQRRVAAMFDDVDVVVTPTADIPAPSFATIETDGVLDAFQMVHTSYWNGTGHPALVVPMGCSDSGMPLSLQIAGRPFEEATVLRAGDAYQRSTPWHLRTPIPSDLDETEKGARHG